VSTAPRCHIVRFGRVSERIVIIQLDPHASKHFVSFLNAEQENKSGKNTSMTSDLEKRYESIHDIWVLVFHHYLRRVNVSEQSIAKKERVNMYLDEIVECLSPTDGSPWGECHCSYRHSWGDVHVGQGWAGTKGIVVVCDEKMR